MQQVSSVSNNLGGIIWRQFGKNNSKVRWIVSVIIVIVRSSQIFYYILKLFKVLSQKIMLCWLEQLINTIYTDASVTMVRIWVYIPWWIIEFGMGRWYAALKTNVWTVV